MVRSLCFASLVAIAESANEPCTQGFAAFDSNSPGLKCLEFSEVQTTAECEGTDCRSGDIDVCCLQRCSVGMEQRNGLCGSSRLPRANAAELWCTTLSCSETNENDLEICCLPKQKCLADGVSITCPEGTVMTTDEDDTCTGETCADTSEDQMSCCRGLCHMSDLSCDESMMSGMGYFVLTEDSSKICQESVCTGADTGMWAATVYTPNCCEERQLCTADGVTVTCNEDSTFTTGLDRCVGATCTDTDEDRAMCCKEVIKPKCKDNIDSYFCPSGLDATTDDSKICAGEACAESDAETCCDECDPEGCWVKSSDGSWEQVPQDEDADGALRASGLLALAAVAIF